MIFNQDEDMTEVAEIREEDRRPKMLLVLSILSFISIGLSILLNMIGTKNGPLNEDQLIHQRVQVAQQKSELRRTGMTSMISFVDKAQAMAEETNNNFYLSKGVILLTDFLGLFGVIFMLRRRKLGFHMYIIYSLLAIGGMLLYVSPGNIPVILPILSAIFGGLFIFLYSRTLHWMR